MRKQNKPTPKATTDDFETASAAPYYSVTHSGVYYHAFDTDKGGNVTEKPPMRLSDPLHLIGYGTDADGGHHRVMQWRDRLSNERHTAALAMADIGTPACWSRLQGMGTAIQSGRGKRDLLADYLMTEGDKTRYLITGKAGWCADNRAYVLPSGEVLSTDKDAPRIVYNGDASQALYYQPRGTLSDWKANIARYATGNSRLCLALGSAFAAPLMRLLDIEGGGFHLFGDSSDGKTTTAKVALSVWGKPDGLKLSWSGTEHAFTNAANAKNDSLMVLDEIGQATQRAVKGTAYSVINGTGKAQGAKEGGNRHINRWRVLVLSTGEKTLSGYLQAGNRGEKADWQAGQANRLPSIPANVGKGYGAFDSLHGFNDGAAFANHLNPASNDYHGTAGRAFVERLLSDPKATTTASDMMTAFMASLPPLTGQAQRVAKRFALTAAALELASDYGVTGLNAGAASVAIRQCFDDWLAREGTGKYEDRQIIEQVVDFMQRNAGSERFIGYSSVDQKPRDFAGYFKAIHSDFDQHSHNEYWITTAVFKNEIAQGYEVRKAREVIAEIGWLKLNPPTNPSEPLRYQHRKKGAGWFYVLIGETNPQDNEPEHNENEEKPSE